MDQPENIGSFFKESKPLVKEYLEIRMELLRLHGIRLISRSAGYLVWILVSLFLLLLIMIFTGIVVGIWLSELFHSYAAGFGITTLLIIVIFILLAIFRNALFVNPVIQAIIKRTNEEFAEEESDS